MSVRLRLRREGTKKKPHFRVVAADKRSPRDGRFIEIIGEYHPAEDPSRIEIDNERALYWLRNGAQPSNTVEKLLRISGAWEEFKPGDEPERVRHPEEAEKAKRQAAAAQEAEEAKRQAAAEQEAEEVQEAEEAPEPGAPEATEAQEAAQDEAAGDAHQGAAPATEEARDESNPEDDTAEPVAETEGGDDAAREGAGGTGSGGPDEEPGEGTEEEASK